MRPRTVDREDRLGSSLHRVLRDDALRSAPVWILLTGLNTTTLLGLVAWWAATARSEVLPPRVLLTLLWLALSIYLLVARQRRRCHRLELGLPIRARALWLSHLVAVYLAGIGVALLSIAGFALLSALRPRGFGALPAELTGGVIHVFAGLLLAVAILQSHWSEMAEIPSGRRWYLLVLSVILLLLLLALTLGPTTPWLALPILAMAFAIAFRTWRRLPGSLVVAPRRAVRETLAEQRTDTSHSTPIAGAESAGRRRSLDRILYSSLYRIDPWAGMTSWLVFPFVVLFGAVMAGVQEIWIDASELRFLYLPFAVYTLLTPFGPVSQNLHRIDPLPIPRRRLFAILVVPAMLALLVGYVGGRALRRSELRRVSQVEYRVEGRYYWVQPPPGYLEVAWDGVVPVLEAPWGETHEAWNRPVVRWSRMRVYSPFNTGDETSVDFEALLTSKAIRSVHGLELDPSEIRRRYFVVEDDRIVGLQEGGLALRRDHPDLKPAESGPEAPLVLAAALALYLIVLALLLRTFRADVSDRLRLLVYWGFLALIILGMFAQMALAISGWLSPEAIRIFTEIGIRRLGSHALGSAFAWLAGAGLVAACYRLALSRFQRIELLPRPARFTLIDFGRDSKRSK